MPAMTFGSVPCLETIDSLHPVLMSMKECVVLDIETTGFSLNQHAEIIEIAAVRLDIEKRRILREFKTFVRPSNLFNIPKKITELTGISWGEVENAPYIEEVLPKLAKFIGDLPVVAHNANFDWIRFLLPSFEFVGLHAANRCICSMKLASKVFPNRGRNGYNLESLCEMYGHKVEDHHDALADSRYTASLFIRLLNEYRRQMDGKDGLGECQSRLEGTGHPASSEIPTVNFNDLVIRRVASFQGASKKAGQSIYVTTNFGKVCYSVRRQLWTCTDLWTCNNVPIQLWGQNILRCMRMDIQTFVERFRIAA